ncbi:MAG TPA: PAC2 family protein [Acidimicrobiales bacterium]
MTDPFVLYEEPHLESPPLVVMLTGWIDAGGAAQMAMAALEDELGARTIATFDGDTFIDYRARRPIMELRDGVNTNLIWPTVELKAGRDSSGHDALLLTGHEPDAAWRHFVDVATSLATDLGARMMVGLGAYPFAAPHSRPSRLSVSCGSPEVAAGLSYLKNSVDVPAGVQAALEQACTARGIPALGLWAQIPHYVSASAYPAASVALLTGLAEVSGISVEATALREEAEHHRARLDELVSANSEHLAVLRQLEEAYDEEADGGPGTAAGPSGGPPPFTAGDLRSGDELAAELERFLREQGS